MAQAPTISPADASERTAIKRRNVNYFKSLRRKKTWGEGEVEATARSISLRDLTVISTPEFELLEIAEATVPEGGRSLYGELESVSAKTLNALPSYLAGLYRVPLLTPYGEQFLFRKLNYLRHWAAVLRDRMNRATTPRCDLVETIQGMLDEIDRTRSKIIESNLRLVVSISRRFADNKNGFEELVSEGNLILMKAVDRFDYSRGFRFSTYATHAVQRHIFRLFQTRQRRRGREQLTTDEILGELMPHVFEEMPLDPQGDVRQLIGLWDECLDEREQYIVSARFGIEGRDDSRTLRDLSNELGISKERVRQVQIRAMEKLRELAETHKVGLEHRPVLDPADADNAETDMVEYATA